MGTAEQIIDALLGESKASEFDPGEAGQQVLGSTNRSEFASSAGGVAGGIIGSMFGPIGSTVGSVAGSKLGEAAASLGGVPAGPGATIEGGQPNVSNAGLSEGGVAITQSLQHLAFRGLQSKSAPSGRGKTF